MFGFFPLILSAFLLGLGFYLLLQVLARKEPANLLRGSMGWPLFGETLGFLKPHRSNSMGSFLQEHCSRYGRVFKSHLFGSPTIVSCDHELNMVVLQNEEKLFQVSYPKAMHGILGKFSLLIVSGDVHKKLRNIGVSFITSSKSNPEFLACVEKMTISMMNSWKNCKEIGFYKEVKKFTLNLMVKHLLSIEAEEPLAFKILEDFLTYMKGFVSLPVYLPGTPYASAVKARARLSATVMEIIKERRKEKLGPVKGDFLDAILSKENLSDEKTVSIVLDMLLAGYETTATLMALIVYFLSLYPNVLEHLKDKATSKKVMPFGGGPRLCPGADLAKVEIAFFLHHLVLNYRWKTMADDFPLAYPYVEFRRGLLLEIEPVQAKAGKIET